jgi:hypothetical protein
MVLGSSNELNTCWRAFLWEKLQDAGLDGVDFVGDVSSGPDCGVDGYDLDLRAQSGFVVSEASAEQFAAWFNPYSPRLVLAHCGGADLIREMPISGPIEGYDRALAAAREANPGVIWLAGQHTPRTATAATALPRWRS